MSGKIRLREKPFLPLKDATSAEIAYNRLIALTSYIKWAGDCLEGAKRDLLKEIEKSRLGAKP
jgi:hypothetical protein